jgi:signal recognition particle receptor subunit beta
MDSTLLIPILVAVAAIIIATVILLSKGGNNIVGSRGHIYLLAGEMSAGKTALYYYLKTGQNINSVTSLQPNSEDVKLKGFSEERNNNGEKNYEKISKKIVSLYDLPGHGSFKALLPKILPQVNTLFFLIDSNTINFNLPAQSLYTFFTNKNIIIPQVPGVIVCTKTDIPTALPLEAIKNRLGQEIEIIRKANANVTQLDQIGKLGGGSADNIDSDTITLTDNKEPFSFEKTKTPVFWIKISVRDGKIGDLAQYFE